MSGVGGGIGGNRVCWELRRVEIVRGEGERRKGDDTRTKGGFHSQI